MFVNGRFNGASERACAPGSQRPSHLRPFLPVTGPGGGGNYTPGTGPENEKTEGNVMTFLEVQCGNGPGDPTTTGHRGDPGAGKLMVLGLTVFFRRLPFPEPEI
jgi:hypothetical protein